MSGSSAGTNKLVDNRPPALAKFLPNSQEPGNTSSSEGEKDSPPPEWDAVPVHRPGSCEYGPCPRGHPQPAPTTGACVLTTLAKAHAGLCPQRLDTSTALPCARRNDLARVVGHPKSCPPGSSTCSQLLTSLCWRGWQGTGERHSGGRGSRGRGPLQAGTVWQPGPLQDALSWAGLRTRTLLPLVLGQHQEQDSGGFPSSWARFPFSLQSNYCKTSPETFESAT